MLRYLFLLSFFAVILNVSALAANIRGRVISAETGEAITGATIRIEGTSHNAVSGLDGSFLIRGISKGEYKMTISMVSYATETINLKADDKTAPLDIVLRTTAKELGNVVVTAARDKSSDAAARNLERTTDRVLNIVSSLRWKEIIRAMDSMLS
ncbi:MAG: carboxypeptidase-like regulatory domain-containing protein [Sphingobacteriales bacterium]|nr:carboxypeptidase-like regulatory domain-containing protein [Sphingobacteriales bacterium]